MKRNKLAGAQENKGGRQGRGIRARAGGGKNHEEH